MMPPRHGALSVPVTIGTIRVLRLGASLGGRLDEAPLCAGRVQSVFSRALNIEWHDRGLVALHGPGTLAAPFAAAMVGLPCGTWLQPGLAVWREPGGLRMSDTVIRWDEAETVDLALAPAAGPSRTVALATREASGKGGGTALCSEAGHRGQRALAWGIRSADAGVFAAGARALIGLGEGLTPAGDDCLVGALAVLRRFGRGRLGALESASGLIAEAVEHGTTTVGRAFLLHALAGEFSEAVADLLTAERPAEARAAARRLSVMGATSGIDTLTGMRLAFEALGWGDP